MAAAALEATARSGPPISRRPIPHTFVQHRIVIVTGLAQATPRLRLRLRMIVVGMLHITKRMVAVVAVVWVVTQSARMPALVVGMLHITKRLARRPTFANRTVFYVAVAVVDVHVVDVVVVAVAAAAAAAALRSRRRHPSWRSLRRHRDAMLRRCARNIGIGSVDIRRRDNNIGMRVNKVPDTYAHVPARCRILAKDCFGGFQKLTKHTSTTMNISYHLVYIYNCSHLLLM